MKRTVVARLLFGIALILTQTSGIAQTRLDARSALSVSADIARFFGDSSQTYLEVYYSIRENCLTYVSDSGRYIGSANFRMIVRTDSSVVVKKEWTVPHILTDSARMHGPQQLIGVEGFGLPPGKYTVILTSNDSHAKSRADSIAMPVAVDRYPSGKEAISDIEFCTMIEQSSNKKSPFYKNTLEVIPNPSKLYGTGLPIIYYYIELYNLMKAGDPGPLTLHTAVVDVAGREVATKDKAKIRSHNASVEIGTMNIGAVRSGTYYFRATLTDTGKTIVAGSMKKFYVYKPGSLPDSTLEGGHESLSAMQFFGMSDTAITLEFQQASYIATEQEKQQFLRLTELRAKQKFLGEFWDRRAPDTLSPVNQFRTEYLKRVEQAGRNFMTGNYPGWKTDRGRVAIVYGQPNDIERFSNSQEASPYEIWHYDDLQGGVIFVFVDKTGLGDFQLVHSTARTELQNDNWYEDYAHKAK